MDLTWKKQCIISAQSVNIACSWQQYNCLFFNVIIELYRERWVTPPTNAMNSNKHIKLARNNVILYKIKLSGWQYLNWIFKMAKENRKEKMFIQIKNIWHYNVYIHKLKLSIKYFNLNITGTSHAEKVSICSQGKFLIQDGIYFDSTVHVWRVWPRCHNKEHVNLWPTILRKTCSALQKLFLMKRLILHNISTISYKK